MASPPFPPPEFLPDQAVDPDAVEYAVISKYSLSEGIPQRRSDFGDPLSLSMLQHIRPH